MGRYTGPKGRVNRRLGMQVFETNGAIKALDNRPTPPGPPTRRRRKVSTYGSGLLEKQKIKYYYGLRDKHLRKYFEQARRIKGNTGEQLMILCERRLDNVVRRAGFTVTRSQARQGIVHSHFQLNGKTVSKPSIRVRAGDVITIRNRPNLKKLYEAIVGGSTLPQCEWVTFDDKGLSAVVTAVPAFDDVSLPVDVGQVVAFMSR